MSAKLAERYLAKAVGISRHDVTLFDKSDPYRFVECRPGNKDTFDTIYFETDGDVAFDPDLPTQTGEDSELYFVATNWTFIIQIVVRNPNNPEYTKKKSKRWKEKYRSEPRSFVEHIIFTADAAPGTVRSCIMGTTAAAA